MRLVPGRISGDGEKGSKSGDFAQRRLVPGLISGDGEKGSKSGDFAQQEKTLKVERLCAAYRVAIGISPKVWIQGKYRWALSDFDIGHKKTLALRYKSEGFLYLFNRITLGLPF